MVRENLKPLQKYHSGGALGTIGLYSCPPVPRKTSRGATAGRYNSNYLLLSVFFDLLPMVTIGRTI